MRSAAALLLPLALTLIGSGAPAETLLSAGRSEIRGILDGADQDPIPETDGRSGPNFFREAHRFFARPGSELEILLRCDFDGYLILLGPDGTSIAQNDDYHSTAQARIAATPTQAGVHRVVVSSFRGGRGGSFTLTVTGLTERRSDRHPTARILSQPHNVACDVGDRFLTRLALHGATAVDFDSVALRVAYDPAVLRPVRVSDHGLQPLLADDPTLAFDAQGGWFLYEATLAQTSGRPGMEFLLTEWEALAPCGRTQIALSPGRDLRAALGRGGRDLLGEAGDPGDGAVATDVTIRPSNRSHLIDGEESLPAIHGVEPRGRVALRLVGPRHPVRSEDVFEVEVRLENSDACAVDDLRFAIRFDPRALEVLDAAPGGSPESESAWIVRGVNLLDTPFHAAYPFDIHMRNQAYNDLGLIDYRMGLTRPRPLPSGTVARIRLRALTASPATPLRLLHGGGGEAPTTAVRCLGADVLAPGRSAGLLIPIAPRRSVAAGVRRAPGG